MSATGFDPRNEIIPSSVANNLARSVQDRRTEITEFKKKLGAQVQQIDQSHSSSGSGTEGQKKK